MDGRKGFAAGDRGAVVCHGLTHAEPHFSLGSCASRLARRVLCAGMIVRPSVVVVGALALVAAACGSEGEESATIAGGVFHLGKSQGVEPTVNLELRSDHTFEWRTDPGRAGDWVPSDTGTWSQAGAIITLRPSGPVPTMAFSATLSTALYPTVSVIAADLRVAERGTLVTSAVKKEGGETWSPPDGVDAREITWERGRACTILGRSNGCIERP